MDDQPMGRRVAYWRNRRRMSQQLFADGLGKSKSWVDKVERGVRRLDRFSVIYEIADVLQLDVQVLLGKDPARRPESVNCVDQVEVSEIRAALERYDRTSTFYAPPTDAPVLPELQKAVGHAWLTFQHSKYGVLARMLPKLLRDSQAANVSYQDEAGREAAHLLGQVYQIASSTLRKLGEHDLAWLAADRSIMVCHGAGDELLTALATVRAGNALAAKGRFRTALEIMVNTAGLMAPGAGREATPQRLSVYGLLLLQGAMAAARLGDSATVRDLVGGAEEAAKQLGGDENYYWTSFGPTNVAFHRAAADVEMGEGGRAVETHEAIDPISFAAMMPERRAHHLLDLARGLAQIGDVGRASESVIDADRLAPSEIRCRPIAQELVADVLRRTRGAPPVAVSELADQMGLTV
jgi:transcriptional regulator with XRE-family HTH domain